MTNCGRSALAQACARAFASHRAVRRDCPARGLSPGGRLCLGDEGRGVLLHQAVQRGLFRAVALVVDRGAIRRPLGLLHRGLHEGLPRW